MLKSRLAALAVIGLGVLSAPFASAEEFVIPPEVLEAFPIPEDAPAKHAAIQGPFAVKMYAEESLASFTLFAPDDPQSWTEPLPVVAWGNGGCINSNVPVRNFLTTIASYGFVVIAPGPLEPTEDGATPPDIQKTALDWATAQNAEAGGKYETTTGCLEAIALTLKHRRPRKMLDVGTGTGVLAIALARRTRLPIVASDIDPIATQTAIDNARDNGVGPLLRGITAAGLDHRVIADGAPFDLIVANILAGPLVHIAPAIGRAAAPRATIILSGLLATQAQRIVTAYATQGMILRQRLIRADWATLILEKR